ncbi:hypothetical protein E3220_17735 (plasmid) [Piscirickettsia salmonis]|nr:hypothetical protein E3220_17735 [Piscirickettsia salmonis]
MLEFLSHNCKEKASFFLIVFFNLLILCQKLLIQRYSYEVTPPIVGSLKKMFDCVEQLFFS